MMFAYAIKPDLRRFICNKIYLVYAVSRCTTNCLVYVDYIYIELLINSANDLF